MPRLFSIRFFALFGLATGALTVPASAQRPAPMQPGLLRVCADPDNLPFSNQKGEGFENKLAELIAREFDSELVYIWMPTRRGYFRLLNGRYCDVAMEAPGGLDMAATTKPYYRSGYVFLTRKDSEYADLKSLADPRLKKARIGVHVLSSDGEQPPPVMALSRYGVVGNLRGYGTFYNEEVRPEDIVNAIAKKEIDVALVWGPLAGYFAKRAEAPLVVTPLPDTDSLTGASYRFDMAMGVRRRDRELRDSLQRVLDRRAPEIQRLLQEYAVPTFPIQDAGRGDDDDERAGATKAPPAAPAPADSTRRPGRG